MQHYDLKFYNEFYEDIKEKQWNNGELLNHYKTFGKKEGRFISENDFYEKYLSFDVDFYQHYHNDLGFCQGNKYQLMRHYDKHGVKEERKCSECYDHCDWNFYNQFYEDINEKKWNNKQLFYHYKIYGKGERRIVSEKNFYSLYPSFDINFYESINSDLNIFQGNKYYLMRHYDKYGVKEGRICCIQDLYKNQAIIYILCHNEEKLHSAITIYKKYWWAKPILMKYQDYSFENSFWLQLLEIQHEWENYNMVGTLSYAAFKKINLTMVDTIITNKLYLPNVYYHFMDSNISIPNNNTTKHPFFTTIWNDVLTSLKLVTTTENNCNYWMCKPVVMKHFIDWYLNVCLKTLTNHPHIFEDSLYTGEDFQNSVNKDRLVKICGKPYYPHYPFVMERLTKTFFVSYYKIVFLISHEHSYTGAVNALLNVKKFYEKQNIRTDLIYLPDIIKNKINIIEYIKDKSKSVNCSPVVICNTLVCYNIVKKLSFTNILTYWYIHEWYDNNNNYFPFIDNQLHLFTSNIYIIFLCNSMFENYKKYIPLLKDKIIINNAFSPDFLEDKKNENQEIIVNKNNHDFIISIIGTIEKRKNQQKFIDDIFYRLVDKYPFVKLLLVGKISEELVINHHYKTNIIQTGVVTNALPYINISDIVVSYSLNEVFPLNMLESFFCSKPVVASNVGGVGEMIENQVNGFLFEVNDFNKCYEYIDKLIIDNELRKHIGEMAKQNFHHNYDENKTFQLFLLNLSKTYKISYASSNITDCNVSYENNNLNTLTILACHTDNYVKINTLINNIKYFVEISDDIIIVNSKEYENLCLEQKIINEYNDYPIICNNILSDELCNSYKILNQDLINLNNQDLRYHFIHHAKNENRQISKNKIVKIYINYHPNDEHLCHGKWLYCLNNINLNIYDNYILSNDSFIVTKSLKKFSDLKIFNTELYGLIASNEIKYHYTDFLRGYNKKGIKKLLSYYDNHKPLVKYYDDCVMINEVNSTFIFENKNVLYESEVHYNCNIHFDEDKIKDYLLNREYPAIKLKSIMNYVYTRNSDYITSSDSNSLILNDYKILYPDLKNYSDNDLYDHYLHHGKNEKKICNFSSFISILPDYLREYMKNNNLLKIFI